MPVNTAKVEGRRKLNYGSYEELLADAQRMSAGAVKTLGNWSPGQIFKHLAIIYNGSIDGLPVRFPWHFRMLVKLFKNKLLSMDMPPGYQMRPGNAKITQPGPTSAEEGLAALRVAIERLQNESHRAKHPLMGNLTREEWDKIHLKHASLHMSFLVQG